MIFPILNGLLRFQFAPVTWLLFLLNASIFFASVLPSIQSQSVIDRLLDDEEFLRFQGRVFAQYVAANRKEFQPLVRSLAQAARSGDNYKLELLGSLAVRNLNFMSTAENFEYQGDQVRFRRWLKQIEELKSTQERHPSYVLGLTADDVSLPRWLSYIFVHSGPYHFLGNMYFLLIFGSMLEPLIGGLALLVVFLLSGMVAAGVFMLVSGATAVPLIGASGAVSGLMALFCLFYWRHPVRFMYFLLPSASYMGVIFLPAWVVLVMFMLSDLAGAWGSMADFGGVAYTAHFGGEAAALLIGVIIYFLRYRKPTRLADADPPPPLGQPISLLELIAEMLPPERRDLALARTKRRRHRFLQE